MERYKNLIPTETNSLIYKEHNEKYLIECIENLKAKNIFIEIK